MMCCAFPSALNVIRVDGPDRCAADLGGVVLDEAVVAPGADEVEVLTVVQLAGGADDGENGFRALHRAVEQRSLRGGVAGHRRWVVG